MFVIILTILNILFATTNSIANPGILIQIHDQLKLPLLDLPLPISIPPISISSLEMTQINLQQIDYNWQIKGSKFILQIPSWLIDFQWQYKKDQGRGTFTQTYLQLTVEWQPAIDSRGYFDIQINKVSLKDGDMKSHIKVHLGGGVSQTVIVEVTDLIINHARFIFRQILSSTLTDLIKSLSDSLKNDIKLVCPEQNECIYLNSTLVTRPLIYEQQILIQINGASYSKNHPSPAFLDPQSAIIKVQNIQQIAFQIHQKLLDHIITTYNQIHPIKTRIRSTDISSITQINTQTLSMVFPEMINQKAVIPVLFDIQAKKIQTLLQQNDDDLIAITSDIRVSISLQRSSQQVEVYVRQIRGTVQIQIKIIYNSNKISLRIQRISLSSLSYNEQDIFANLIKPEQFQKHIPTLMQWMQSGLNGSLNEKIQRLEFKGADLTIIKQILRKQAAGLQIKIKQQQTKNLNNRYQIY